MTEPGSRETVLDQARAAVADGERALSGHDPRAAEKAFSAALGMLGEQGGEAGLAAAAHLGLGRVRLAGNDIRAADLNFDRVQRLLPAAPDGFYWAGCTAARAASYPRAEWLLTAALERDPRYRKAYARRAEVRLKLGRAESALADLLAAADDRAADDRTRLATAAVLVRLGKAERALAAAAGIEGGAAAAVCGLARWQLGETEAAAAEFERAVAAGCRDEAVLFYHGLACFRRGDAADGEAAWQPLRAEHGELAEAVEETNLRDAVRHLERGEEELAAARLRESGRRGHRCLAVLEFRAGQHESAVRRWRAEPADPVSRWGLAVNAMREGAPAEAELRELAGDETVPARIRRLVADSLTGHQSDRKRTAARCAEGIAAARRRDWAAAAETLPEHSEEVSADVALLKAVACAVSGRRAEAVAQLAAAAAAAPRRAGSRIGHARAMLYLHTLSAAEGEPDVPGWRACIGATVALLHDAAFWTSWQTRASQRYRCPVPADAVRAARTALDELIEHRVPSDELAVLLRRERAAAALLAEAGGLPGPAGPPLVCGPLWLAELGLERQLGEFVRALAGTGYDAAALRRQFSALGLATALLAAGRSAAAARAALDVRCPSCAETGGESHPAMITEPLQCAPGCPEFDRRNPGFSAGPDKTGELSRAGAALAVRTLLDLARGAIARPVMDLADARRCWRAAVTLARRFDRRDAILREAADEALGRAKVLAERGDRGEAIAVLDAVAAAIPAKDAVEHGRVAAELAFLLNARGVGVFNDRPDSCAAALADLRRAVALCPDLQLPRFNLGIVLRAAGVQAARGFDYADGIRLLTEAVSHFEYGATVLGAEQFRPELERARDMLKLMVEAYEDRPPEENP
ncbi:hypothetical protein [Amycolatopsis sp. NPDC004079]|uniref:hypothetical protein n=1 Tax=Amycolatopsis sp. NPDC004079 TaxID=3154549 RepID=UPI0033BCF958